MAKTVILYVFCLAVLIKCAQCQKMNVSTNGLGICKGGKYRFVAEMKTGLKGCVVVVGYIQIGFTPSETDFSDTQFPDLREITEYLVIYKVKGLESVGQIFPALTRIRGNKLFDSYALIVYENPNLREVALYNLLKIDRGGIIIWGSPQACYINTIDWNVLAPKERHVISRSEGLVECNVPCNCMPNGPKNRCWNNKKCQLFVDEENCHDQCLGCRKTAKDVCFTCQNYNHQFECVPKCPPATILLPDSNYCITKKECYEIKRFVWNNTCVSECPINFKYNNKTLPTCESCTHCDMTCSSLLINSVGAMEPAEKCVYIKGSLTILIRNNPYAVDDLKKYLNKIQEVSDYIFIDSSEALSSLDFLPSLRVIKGKKLQNNKYSLFITNNENLETLFTPEVTKNLIIKRGTAGFQQNPVLCMSVINQLKDRLPTVPSDIDIPIGSNGYSGGCKEVPFNFTILATTTTSIHIKFLIGGYDTQYTALYTQLPPDIHIKAVPENCCNFEWHTIEVPTVVGQNFSTVELKGLMPATTYSFCVEIYNSENKQLTRSKIVNLATETGTPEPPFITELVAVSSNLVVLTWTDLKNYIDHIQSYELDVELLEMSPRESMTDYCQFTEDFFEDDDLRHAIVTKAPHTYKRDCKSKCGQLSSAPPGIMAQEYFDVCNEPLSCSDTEETKIERNTTYENYVKTLTLQLDAPRHNFQVGGLAPFSDYRFRLRACVGHQCSRSAREIVRTYRTKKADYISNVLAYADTFGVVTVQWETPKLTNGPVLSYFVEVYPKLNESNIMPHIVCVRANETTTVVKSVPTSKYLVRVCLRTLATPRNCTDWVSVEVPLLPTHTTSKLYLLWTGVLCAILMYIIAFLAGCLKIRRPVKTDMIPLVDHISSCRVESDPPAQIFSEFMFHTIPIE